MAAPADTVMWSQAGADMANPELLRRAKFGKLDGHAEQCWPLWQIVLLLSHVEPSTIGTNRSPVASSARLWHVLAEEAGGRTGLQQHARRVLACHWAFPLALHGSRSLLLACGWLAARQGLWR
ncbi:hypothetical protein OAN61_00225, partial [bacterium]|nr:hypothetical protein [bacterium]